MKIESPQVVAQVDEGTPGVQVQPGKEVVQSEEQPILRSDESSQISGGVKKPSLHFVTQAEGSPVQTQPFSY